MKVSSTIKTPVRVGGPFGISNRYQAIEDFGDPYRFEIRGTEGMCKAAAHAINSHDPLVTMVHRLCSKLCDIQGAYQGLNDPFQINHVISEADELLKGEDG